jgi:hypothetical protein
LTVGRPRLYASDADKQAAHRNRWRMKTARLPDAQADTIEKIAIEFDVSEAEVLYSLINFALLNRDWMKQGLFGKRLPRADDPPARKAD